MNLTTSGTHNLTTLGIYANNIEKIEKQEQKISICGGVIDKIDFEILQKTDITYLAINLSKIREITFPQCTNLEIYFSGVTFDNVVRFKSKFYGALWFANCVFNDNAVFENATFNNVEFIYCVFNQQANFIKSVFKNTERLHAMQFRDTKFLGSAYFSDNIFYNNIGFYNVEFQKELIIRHNKFECDRVVFNVTCQAKVTCMPNNFKHEIVINESKFNHDVLLSIDFNASKGKEVEIKKSIINGDMALAHATFSNILIQQSSFNKEVGIFVENFSNTEVIKISNTTFNLLFIQKEIFKKRVIFEKCMFLKSMDFKEYEFQKVAFNTCIFSGNMYFNNAVFKDSIDFHECEFEKTACFYGVTFHNKAIPNFSQAIFKENLNFVNVKCNFDFENLKESIKQAKEKEQDSKKTLDKFANDFRDSFRLIKNALIKDNNLLDASNFHKYELYCKEIELEQMWHKQGKTTRADIKRNTHNFRDYIDYLLLGFYRKLCEHHTDFLKVFNNLILLIVLYALFFKGIAYLHNAKIENISEGFILSKISNNFEFYFNLGAIVFIAIVSILMLCNINKNFFIDFIRFCFKKLNFYKRLHCNIRQSFRNFIIFLKIPIKDLWYLIESLSLALFFACVLYGLYVLLAGIIDSIKVDMIKLDKDYGYSLFINTLFVGLYISLVYTKSLIIGRYILLIASYIGFFIVLIKYPSIIHPLIGKIADTDKTCTCPSVVALSILYTILIFLVLFSLQKTARKNSIIPH